MAAVKPKPAAKKTPEGHAATAAPLIGAMSFLLAAGLEKLGLLRGADAFLATTLSRSTGDFPNALPPLWLWSGTAVLALAIPGVLLATPAQWRRVLLWILVLLLTAGWAPVLALAACEPKISAAWIAAFWSGFCALYYASHHRMPVEMKSGK